MPNPSLFTSVINSYLPEPQSILLNGILFGVKLKKNTLFYNQLQIVGLLHLVVLSGTNITLLIAIVMQFTQIFSRKVSVLIAILTVILFTAFVPLEAPVLRASIMGILTLVANLLGRKTISLYLLFLSGLISILLYPQWLTNLSFLLTYSASLGLIIFNRKTPLKKENDSPFSKLKEFAKADLFTSLSAQIFTVPLIFIYFKQVSFISPIANLLIAWTIPALMIFGFLTSFLGKINYALGLIPSYFCYGILTYDIFVVRLLSKIPFGFVQF